MKYFLTILSLVFSSVLLAQDVNMQTATVNQCGGVFYDSGGEFGNYGDDENFILTICPENPGQKIRLEFTAFNTQVNQDILSFFNGDDITAPTFGDFSGVGSPGTVEATQDNVSGCITIQFVSSPGGTIDGWAANITCLTPCQTINSQFDSSSPAPNGDGYIRVCPNEEITLNGNGMFSIDGTGATYEWDFGNGTTGAGQTTTVSYPDPGVYIVNLNIRDANTSIDPLGCENNNLINQVIQVATEPDFTGTQAANDTLCFGDSTDITGMVEAVEFINDCTPPVSGITFLPDGNGVTYETSVTVDCYDSAQTLTDISQLVSICLTMEHSYLGDLDIEIISPNGQVVRMHDQGGGSANLGIPWATGTVDGQSGNTTPGEGHQYCFVPGGGFPTLVGGIQNGGIFPNGNGPGTYNDSFVPIGNYSSVNPLDGLLGSPLNGDWTIRVVDNIGADNGHIFAWSIEFDPALQPPELSFTPVITSEAWDADPSIINTVGNVITVQPTAEGQICYTYRVTDDFGCEYTEEVCIDVLPEIVTENPNNLFICDTGMPPYLFDLGSNTAVVLASATNAGDLVVSYHNSLADADADTGAIAGLGSYSGTDGETIFIRVEYLVSGCYEVLPFTLNVAGQPTINPVTDLELCDDLVNDGLEEFDLSVQTATILGAQSAADFNVTYHLSFADADAGTGVLPLLYTNTINPEPIFVRVESVGDSNCYNASAMSVFNLVVNARAIATMPSNMVVCDDVSNDGFATFDLSTQEGTILGTQDPATFTVSYHTSQADADTNTGALPTSYTNITNPETIFVRVEDPLNPTCYGTTSFDLIVNPLPALVAVTPLQVCDDDTDGFSTFTLSTKVAEILNGQTGVDVSFHETLVGAQTDTAEIFDGYMNTTMSNQTVFIRLENTASTCYNVNILALEVIENPTANATTPLEVCDDDNDGFAEFDLSLRDAQVIGAQTGMVVSYYDTMAEAMAGNNPLPTNYTNIVAGAQGIFARIESGSTGCYAITTLQLIVNPQPTTITVTDYELCDDDNPGDEQELFDLSTKDAEILDGQVNVTVTYYANQMDADMSMNAITALYANTSNPQTIVAVLTNTITNCNASTTFDLVVNPLPAVVAPTALEVCDDGTPDGLTEIDLSIKNTEITGNNPGYSVSYYNTLADAQSETSPLPTLYTNMTNPETVFVRVEDTGTGCFDTTTLELIVEQAPIAFTPQPLRYCDPDNDGFGIFDLTTADNAITGGAAGLTVTYHETLANANNNADAIDTSVMYNNIVVNMQTLYARVESATIATNCATVVEVLLIVEPTPQLIDPTALEECDDISADGFATFDLTSKADEVLNGQDPTQYLVSYYETEANAEAANNPIANPAAYTNTTAFNQVIWIRVEDSNTVEGCYKLTSLELIVNALPVLVAPNPLSLCDVNNPGDEQEAFTLEDANAEILNGQTGITITYYETQMDADTATSPIGSPYTNTMTAQTIYVRAENDITGCYNTITLTLRVDPIPSPETDPEPIEVCDEDNDGFSSEFDLEIRTIAITNGEPNVVITYHETEEEANQGDNPITGLYTNIVANSQMIYVRAENTMTGCYSLTVNTLELIVVPSPEVPTDIAPYIVCDDNADGITQFDLTTKDAEILGTQNPADVILTYHVSAADAETGNNPIINTTNYTNNANPQVIYVRLFNPTVGCQDTGMFELQVQLPPEAVQPTPLEECDDLGESPGDEMTIFDLTVKDAEITGGNASWSVAYYETDADAQAQMNAIPDPTQYTNTSVGGLPQNPQTLYVVVTDTDTGCVDFTTMTIRVLPNPTPTPSDQLPDLELCDEINVGDGVETFDLTANEILILNGEAGVTPTYHTTPEDADSGMNAIADPTSHINTESPEEEIYVRVTNDVTGCYTIVNFTIIVHPLPTVVAVTDFIQCELNTDGFDNFDLTTKDEEVLNGQDATQYIVTYHENVMDAQDGINALVSPYTNLTNPQQIFVRITNNVTDCAISTQSFNIQVDEAAEANPDMDPILYEECDDNMETDNNPSNDSVQFDLATQDEDVLDGQDPMNYIVTYYATEMDANLNVNPLPNLYENIVNPQVIYARVDNNTLSVIPIALDLAALGTGLDLNADGTVDTYDTDADGVFDLVDVDGDGLSDAIDNNADGIIDFIDIDGDGLGDAVDLNNDGTFDNQADGSICFAVAPLTLQVNPLPEFNLDDSYILCVNTNGTEVLNVPVLDTELSDVDYSFEWSYNGTVLPAETGSSLIPNQGGTYSVLVTNIITGCTNTDSAEVIESEPPSLTAEIVTQLFTDSNVIEAVATGIGDYEYSLDNGPWQDSGIFTDVSQGEHVVIARDKIGCGETTIDVPVIDYPLYFTPNGDGNHDTWNIEGIGSTAKIYIFDRYGKLLKQLSPTGSGWDGTFNGKMMPTSDYWFMLEYDEPLNGNRKEFKAHFTLKR